MKTLARTTLSSGLVICLTTLLISSYAHGVDKLIVKDATGVITNFVVTDTGMVGIGTASPTELLHIFKNQNTNTQILVHNPSNGTSAQADFRAKNDVGILSQLGVYSSGNTGYGAILASNAYQYSNSNIVLMADGGGKVIKFATGGSSEKMRIDGNGNVGIGTPTPAAQLHTTGTVLLAGVTNCASGIKSDVSGNLSCIVSSRQFKNVLGDLTPVAALANVMALRPQVGSYKATPDEPEHWLIAEDVAAVDPALVGTRDGKPYTVKTQNIIADLIAVIQQQQRGIEQQQRRIEALEQRIAR